MSPARTPLRLRPTALRHRGRIEATGVLLLRLDPDARPLESRALALLEGGDQLLKLPEGLWLRFARPRWVDAATLPGLAVVRLGRIDSCFPLSAVQLEWVESQPGGVLLRLVEGEPRAVGLAALEPVDPATWVAAQMPPLELPRPLGAEPRSLAVLQPAAPPPEARQLFGLKERDARAVAVQRALLEPRGADVIHRPVPVEGAPEAPGLLQRLLGTLAALAARLFAPTQTTPTSATPVATAKGLKALPPRAAPQAPPPPPPVELPRGGGLLNRLRNAFREAVWASWLGRFARQEHAAYLAKLLGMFESGDLDEALKHAIGLGSGVPSSNSPALLPPGPRSSLALDTHKAVGGGGGSLGLGSELFETLRSHYRRGVQQLLRKERFDEAAFVLSELLGEHAEAVQLLSTHGRHRLAAELAEMRGLAVTLRIRLWLKAGELQRAVALARETDSFAPAIALLQQQAPEQAVQLRREWAGLLARQGRFIQAVQVAADGDVVPASEVTRWLGAAVALGGAQAGEAWARLLEGPSATWEVEGRLVVALLEARAPDTQALRDALLRALPQRTANDLLRAVARVGVRSLRRDQAAGLVPREDAWVRALLKVAADPLLEEDLPPFELRPDAPASVVESEPVVEGGDPLLPFRSMALLPEGRVLVAHGEAGVSLLNARGRRLARWSEPAHALAVSRVGASALLLARRGGVTQVTRLDLVTRQLAPFGELRIDGFAESFDGDRWFVAEGRAVLALDATAARPQVLWRVAELPGAAASLADGDDSLFFLTLGAERERWRYRRPDLALVDRRALPETLPAERLAKFLVTSTPNGELRLTQLDASPEGPIARLTVVAQSDAITEFVAGPPAMGVGRGETVGSFAFLPARSLTGMTVSVFDRPARTLRMRIHLPTATSVQLAVEGPGALLIGCDQGRLLRLHLPTLRLERILGV